MKKKITLAEREMLWGEREPYSEAKITVNHRIMGDGISRVMVEVEGSINPTTFRLVKKNARAFVDDIPVLQILQTARYQGRRYGYLISAGEEEFEDALSIERAEHKVTYMQAAIIRMHVFAMRYYGLQN